MIALDTNIIIHLLVKSQQEHARVKRWFEQVKEPLATTQTNIAETLRLLTHPKIFPRPLGLSSAIDLIDRLILSFSVNILDEEEFWWKNLKDLSQIIPSLKGNEIADARIALALRHNGIKKIATFDSDFRKYPFLVMVTI